MQKGSKTPWGAVQGSTRLARGIDLVWTAGHGGIHLDSIRRQQFRNTVARVNPEWRPFTGSWEWLEEDCDAAIAFWVFRGDIENDDARRWAESNAAGAICRWNPTLAPLVEASS